MKKTRLTSCLLALLAALLMLGGCGGSDKLVYQGEGNCYERGSDGTVYYMASINYRALAIDRNRVVSEIDENEGDDTPLYAIGDADSNTYLDSAHWMADDRYSVYYDEDTVLPKLWEMGTVRMDLLMSDEILYPIAAVTEADRISALVERYQNGFSVDYSDKAMRFSYLGFNRYELSFVSGAYKGLAYILLCNRYEKDVTVSEEIVDAGTFVPSYAWEYKTETREDGKTYAVYNFGRTFIYDRPTGRCYPADDLLGGYFS